MSSYFTCCFVRIYSLQKCGVLLFSFWQALTHRGRMTHVCINKLSHHCFKKWFVAFSAPSYHFKVIRPIFRLNPSEKVQWNLNWNTWQSIKWNTFENVASKMFNTWWRHQMETFSAVLAICAGNSPVPGEFPAQRPVARSFNVFFDLRLNKRLSNQREAGDLRRYRAHYDVNVMILSWPQSVKIR